MEDIFYHGKAKIVGEFGQPYIVSHSAIVKGIEDAIQNPTPVELLEQQEKLLSILQSEKEDNHAKENTDS